MADPVQTDPDSSYNDTLALLFFVVALIYCCFLVALSCRTAIPIFSFKKYPNTTRMKMFRTFYGALLIQMFLNATLYWVLFGEVASKDDNVDDKSQEEGFTSVALIFLPYVLMCFDYAVLYLQLEEMQKGARMQGGVAYIKKEQHDKLARIMRIITLAYVAAFMVIQIGLMIFTCLDMGDTNNFLVELNTLVAILMIFVNANALVSYCRNAGNPYLNEKNKKYVRKFKVVIIVWNVAYLAKFLFSSIGVTIVDMSESPPNEEDFKYSVETFANIMLTEIIPVYFVIDKKIIKIMTLKFLDNVNEGEPVNASDAELLAERNDSGSSSTE